MFVYSLNPAKHSSVSGKIFFCLFFRFLCPSLWVTHFLIVFIVDGEWSVQCSASMKKANGIDIHLFVCLQCIIDVVPKKVAEGWEMNRPISLSLFPPLNIRLFYIPVRRDSLQSTEYTNIYKIQNARGNNMLRIL